MVEAIDVDLDRGRLKATDKMSRESDARDGKSESTTDEQEHRADSDRIANVAFHDPIEIAALGIGLVLSVATESDFAEEVVRGGE